MGVSQFYDAMIAMESQPRGADDPTYVPPRGHDRELSDSERAMVGRSGIAEHKARLKVRHGQDALGVIPSKLAREA